MNVTLTKRINIFALMAAGMWSLILGASLYWNISEVYRDAYAQVANTARANFFKDQAIRFWASDRGGVYVEPSAKTPPSPWLAHIPERDVITQSGRKLTLMNPAYMLRQMMDEFSDLYGVKGRIVGIVALNPNNLADEWETRAIRAFEKGVPEASEISDIGGKSYLRLMRPMYMTPDCMKCHGHLGFKVGDVRGGVGVSVPVEEYIAPARSSAWVLAGTHSGVWLFGLFGIGFVSRRAKEGLRQRDEQDRLLRESEERLRLVIKGANDGIWDWNILTHEDYHSARWKEILGYASDELPNHDSTFFERIHPDDRERLNAVMSAHLDRGEPYQIEHRLKHKDGSYRWVLSRGEAVRDAEGKPIRMVGTMTDITERKQMFSELMQHREHLEEMVRQRTQELEHAKENAEKANRAKSEFLSHMSHELRTPLNAVLGFAQLLEADTRHPLSEKQVGNTHQILEAGWHLLGLVNDVLDLAAIEQGKTSLLMEPVEVAVVLDECTGLLAPLAAAREVNIATLPAKAHEYRVLADRSRLKQVLMNLLSNAVKYNRQGGSVSIECRPESSDRLRILISDTGSGIPAAALPELFLPFHRLEIHRSQADGTGIGLSVVKHLVELMGGSVGVESREGRGSTFWFDLKLAD